MDTYLRLIAEDEPVTNVPCVAPGNTADVDGFVDEILGRETSRVTFGGAVRGKAGPVLQKLVPEQALRLTAVLSLVHRHGRPLVQIEYRDTHTWRWVLLCEQWLGKEALMARLAPYRPFCRRADGSFCHRNLLVEYPIELPTFPSPFAYDLRYDNFEEPDMPEVLYYQTRQMPVERGATCVDTDPVGRSQWWLPKDDYIIYESVDDATAESAFTHPASEGASPAGR